MATIVRTSSGRWRARIRRPGAPPQSKNFGLKADAEAWARGVEAEIERGLWRDSGEAERTTLREACERYEREIVPTKRGDGKTDSSNLRIICKDPIARMALARIRSADVAALRDRWTVRGLEPATIRRRLNTFSHVFTVARTDWGMESLRNPKHGVRLKSKDDSRSRRVSEKEIQAIAAAKGKGEELPDFMRLAVETAMRRGELCKLEWSMIDAKKHVAHLPGRITKNGRPRDVWLSDAALATLRDRSRLPHGRVFDWCNYAPTQAFNRAKAAARKKYLARCKERGAEPERNFLVDLRLHDLRHEATSRLALIFDVGALAKITGHLDTKMLMRYYHPTPEDLNAMAEAKLAQAKMRPRRDSNARPAA